MWEKRLVNGVPMRQCSRCGMTFLLINDVRRHMNQLLRQCPGRRPISNGIWEERQPDIHEGMDTRINRSV